MEDIEDFCRDCVNWLAYRCSFCQLCWAWTSVHKTEDLSAICRPCARKFNRRSDELRFPHRLCIDCFHYFMDNDIEAASETVHSRDRCGNCLLQGQVVDV